MNDYLRTLQERQQYLHARIEAKKKVGWEYQYDEREAKALGWAISLISNSKELNKWQKSLKDLPKTGLWIRRALRKRE